MLCEHGAAPDRVREAAWQPEKKRGGQRRGFTDRACQKLWRANRDGATAGSGAGSGAGSPHHWRKYVPPSAARHCIGGHAENDIAEEGEVGMGG